MNKSKIIIILALLVASLGAKAQDIKHLIKVNPIGQIPLFNLSAADLLSYEYVASEHSTYGGGFIYNNVSLESGSEKFSYTRTGVLAEYRYYTSESKKAPKGFYLGVGPEVNIYSLDYKTSSFFLGNASATANATTFALSTRIGWQWILGKHFVLGVGGGLRFGSGANFNYDIKYSGGTIEKGTFSAGGGVLPSFNISLGGAF